MFGVLMALVVGVVILGGIKSIAKVTDKIVPFMVGIYILGALWVILTNLGAVPDRIRAHHQLAPSTPKRCTEAWSGC